MAMEYLPCILSQWSRRVIDQVSSSGSEQRVVDYSPKRCYFASILFGKSVSKKMHHLSFRALANDVNCSTESQPNVLYLIV